MTRSRGMPLQLRKHRLPKVITDFFQSRNNRQVSRDSRLIEREVEPNSGVHLCFALEGPQESKTRHYSLVLDWKQVWFLKQNPKIALRAGRPNVETRHPEMSSEQATMTGNYVWSHSILTVTKGSTVERWKTQQIINTSKLGRPFNQWPTRKVK